MTQLIRNVKSKLEELWGRLETWFVCHPKTLAYITFFLVLNYILDWVPHLF